MKIRIRQPYMGVDNQVFMANIGVKDLRIDVPALIAFDGSSTNTGVAILRRSDGAIMYTMSLEREKNTENPVQYKLRFKAIIEALFESFPCIQKAYYEEPIIQYAGAVNNLMMLRTSVEEVIEENRPKFNHIDNIYISNMRWKKLFLHPDKVPTGTVQQKKAVRAKLESGLPFLNMVTQDEIDAIAMGYVAAKNFMTGSTDDELKSKPKAKPFQYEIRFIGADLDEIALEELQYVYDGPRKVLENGITIKEIKGKNKFDKSVYEEMSTDDRVVIIKFPSNTHMDLILKHRVGYLVDDNEYIYAVVWRKYRKY